MDTFEKFVLRKPENQSRKQGDNNHYVFEHIFLIFFFVQNTQGDWKTSSHKPRVPNLVNSLRRKGLDLEKLADEKRNAHRKPPQQTQSQNHTNGNENLNRFQIGENDFETLNSQENETEILEPETRGLYYTVNSYLRFFVIDLLSRLVEIKSVWENYHESGKAN